LLPAKGTLGKGALLAPPYLSRLPAPILALASAVAAKSAAAFFLWPGFIDVERPTIEFPPVESGNGLLTLAIVAHFYEAEASGAAGIAVGYDVYTLNRAIGLKHGSNRIFGSAEAEVSNKNIFHLIFFLKFAGQRIKGRKIGG
jgi:hypothetical protein